MIEFTGTVHIKYDDITKYFELPSAKVKNSTLSRKYTLKTEVN